MNLLDVEADIIKLLNNFTVEASEKKYKRSEWTNGIMSLLAFLGDTKGYLVCGGKYDRSWLYDLVWYKNDEQGRLIDVPLVIESEWDHGIEKIKYDFEKLLLAKAPFRLMICEAVSDVEMESFIEYFREVINNFKFSNSGDRYLIAILDYYNIEFTFRLLIKNDAGVSVNNFK